MNSAAPHFEEMETTCWKTDDKRLFALCRLSAIALFFAAAPLRAQYTSHTTWSVVPAPEAGVAIDGDLSDWDTSGGVFISKNIKAGLCARSAWAYAMHDRDYLYLAFRVFDDTPMQNTVDPEIMPGKGWRGDCIQVRLDPHVLAEPVRLNGDVAFQ